MEGDNQPSALGRYKFHLLIGICVLALVLFYALSDPSVSAFMSKYWKWVLLGLVGLVVIIWAGIQVLSVILFRSLRERRDKIKERARAKDMQFGVHRE